MTKTRHVPDMRKYINALGTVLTVCSYSFPQMTGADMAKIDLKKSMTPNTFPNSDAGTILVIIERITTVVVESRNAIPEARYTIQVAVESANMSALIIDVNASATRNKNFELLILYKFK